MKKRKRFWKIIGWCFVMFVATLVGGGYFAFTYVTDNETLRAAITEGAKRFLPTSQFDMNRVLVRPIAGRITLQTVMIRQFENGIPKLFGSSPWIQINYDPWAMLDGKFDLKEVVVAQPKLRIRRRKDGTWNFVGFLANPWPLPPGEYTPVVRVENGIVELVDEADGPDAAPAAILRDVSVRVTSGDLHGTPIRFEGTAKGDSYDNLKLSGSFDRTTGCGTVSGDINRLVVSKNLNERLPFEVRKKFREAGLQAGEADVIVKSVTYNPHAKSPINYDFTVKVRGGVWKCEHLPFPLSELAATVRVNDGMATIIKAEGRDGPTFVRGSGAIRFDWDDVSESPFQLSLGVDNLEIERVRDWSIRTFTKTASNVWNGFQPKGRADLDIQLARKVPGGKLDWTLGVECLDMAMIYKDFAYPLQHVSGDLLCREELITLDLHTTLGDKPISMSGRIERPGPDSMIDLKLTADSLPIDSALLTAMPEDIRAVINSFKPAGTVKGTAQIKRFPPTPIDPDPKGRLEIHSSLDLNPGCEMTWDGLKYAVRDLTGHLEIHPNSWTFTNLKGSHGQATITGNGQVDLLAPNRFRYDIHINANNLLFESQLHDALQDAWKNAWDTLNPTGASDVDVRITREPEKGDHYHLEITPRRQTNLRLKFERAAQDGETGPRQIEMPMEDVTGRFVYDDGVVTMSDGSFLFRNSPVRFGRGSVRVFDSGAFTLNVDDLTVKDFLINSGLRKLMPPSLANYALRVDEGHAFTVRANLQLAWSGKAGDPAMCAFDHGIIVFNDNAIVAGMPLQHIQGQIDNLHGSFNGQKFEVFGALDLASINVAGLQITDVTTPIEIADGEAKLVNIEGTFLDGKVGGNLVVGLSSTPKFKAHLRLDGANLEKFARSMPGKQNFHGLLSGQIDLAGLGPDLHSLQGGGEAHIIEGDLGKLPAFLKLVSRLNLAPTAKTAFDKADVWFTIRNGQTTFNPIQFFGYAFSLHGRGSLDVQGDLDVKLRVLYGRDSWHVFLLSDAFREASGQIFVIRVSGTPAAPSFRAEPLPQAIEFVKSLRLNEDGRALRNMKDSLRRQKPAMPELP